jgi:3-hydroxyacyl-CoA dehydrogenase
MAEIKTVAVIGAGGRSGLGRGIACATARAGYRTILEDILPASLRKAEAEIRAALTQGIEQGTVSSAAADSSLLRLEFAGTVEEAARPADLVIEAVPDEMESKLEIFTLLDRICRPETILASTTVSLRVGEIASITYRPRRILGMRFIQPVAEMRTLELVRTRETDDQTIAACAEVGRRMGKEVAVIAEDVGNGQTTENRFAG